MHTIIAPYPVLPGRRSARRVAAASALVAGFLASVCFTPSSQAAEVAAATTLDKQAPLLVGLRRHAATSAAATHVVATAPARIAEPPVKPQIALPQIVLQPTIPAPNAPVPPTRPSEYCVQQAAELDAPVGVDAPLPPMRPAEYSAPAQTAQVFVDMPLPPARPEGLGSPSRVAALPPGKEPDSRPAEQRPAEAVAPQAPVEPRRMATRETTVVPGAAAPQEPSFFDRLFGRAETPQPEQRWVRRHGRRVLAYAAQEPASGSSFFGGSSVLQNASPHISGDRQTAIYDISAQTVFLPDGTRLEAHSGLRENRDNPHSVNLRMRGSTPPNVYELTPREQLFHGVQALRLNPVAGHTYGRTGLLAHTFMLGPNGDSNGCVSFRDYHAFLRAYQSGQIRRLAVVAHR